MKQNGHRARWSFALVVFGVIVSFMSSQLALYRDRQHFNQQAEHLLAAQCAIVQLVTEFVPDPVVVARTEALLGEGCDDVSPIGAGRDN